MHIMYVYSITSINVVLNNTSRIEFFSGVEIKFKLSYCFGIAVHVYDVYGGRQKEAISISIFYPKE